VTLVLLVRHGLTAATGSVLTGRMPGIGLDDRGREQARTLGARLAEVHLDAIVTSTLERCQQTAAAIAATRDGQQVITDDRVGECHYGDWTGQPLKKLVREQLWRVVQAHPSAVTFPGPDGESMPDMQHRAVAAVREWNARLGKDATYLICSHGDVIKAIVADSLGLHLDQCQRIQADPCSLTVIRYTPLRPFLVRMNDRGGGVDDLMPRADGHARGRDSAQSDAAIGGGAGGGGPETPENLADRVNGASSIPAGAAATSGQQSADTRG
jgi:probable phosphomutase (TIGR03848 family)